VLCVFVKCVLTPVDRCSSKKPGYGKSYWQWHRGRGEELAQVRQGPGWWSASSLWTICSGVT